MSTTILRPRISGMTNETLDSFFQSPSFQRVLDVLGQHEVVQVEPGVSVSLHDQPGHEPFLTLTKDEHGAISGDFQGELPSPAPKSADPAIRPNYEKAGSDAVLHTLKEHFHREYCREADHCGHLVYRVNSTLERLPGDQRAKFLHQGVMSNFFRGFRSLIDQEVWKLSHRVVRKVPLYLSGYNAVVLAKSAVDELISTNPGLVGWYIHLHNRRSNDQAPPILKHPGQIVSCVRQSAAENDLNSSAWRFLAALPADFVYYLLHSYGTAIAARIINGIPARLKVPPARSVVAYARDEGYFRPDRELNDPIITFGDLLLGESAQRVANRQATQKLLIQQGKFISDWIRNRPNRDDPIRSRTWNGLLKKAERWHRQRADQQFEERRQHYLERSGGIFHAWNSLVDVTTHRNLEAVPLSNEQDLIRESIRMRHCVDGFGSQCAEGNSRIFAIRDSESKTSVATGEITIYEESWSIRQVKSYRNAPAPEEAVQLMRDVNVKYNLRYSELPPPERHSSWFTGNDGQGIA